MRSRRVAAGLAGLGILCSIAGTAGAVTLDFETRDPILSSTVAVEGRFNDTTLYPSAAAAYRQFELSHGVVLSTSNPGTNPLALFDSGCNPVGFGARSAGFCASSATDGDADLATGPAFNSLSEDLILIVNETADGETDDAVGGDIIFDFTSPAGVTLNTIVMIDIGETLPTPDALEFFVVFQDFSSRVFTRSDFGTEPGLSEELVNPDFPDDNSYRRFNFGFENIRRVLRLEVRMDGIEGGVALLKYEPDVPLPAAMPLLLSALGALGWLGWRRRRSQEV